MIQGNTKSDPEKFRSPNQEPKCVAPRDFQHLLQPPTQLGGVGPSPACTPNLVRRHVNHFQKGHSLFARLLQAMVLLLFICSCTTSDSYPDYIPFASPEQDQTAKAFSPIENKSVVYVYCSGEAGVPMISISVDNIFVDLSFPNTFLRYVIEPGSHFIACKSTNECVVNFTTEPNRIYYVKQVFNDVSDNTKVQIHFIPETEAKSYILKSRLVEMPPAEIPKD